MPLPIFKVLLDTNVLFPAALCDTLLRVADAGLYQLYWSEEILQELERALIREQECTEAGAKRRVTQMKTYFPAAMVRDYEHLVEAMRNDEGDRHVAGAAVAAGVQVIVTSNLRHFRREDLPPNIEAQSPDEFLTSLLSLRPDAVMHILRGQAADLRNPPMTVGELIEGLAHALPEFSAAAREQLRR